MVTKKDKHLAAAQKYLERGSLEKALTEFQNAVREDAKDTRTWLRMAEVHVRLGQNDKATEVYQKTVDLYVEQGFFQRAVAVYKNIIKLSPEAIGARIKLADVYRQLGLFSDAIQQLEQAVALHQKMGQLTEALTAMRQILELNPEQPAARIRFAELAAQAGETDQSVAEFREAANLLKAQGRADEFIRVAERILYYQPEDLTLGKELAASYLDRNNARAALARLKPAFEANQGDPDVLDLLARCFEQLGQPHKCLPVLKELCRLYGNQGRTAERNQTIQRALALDPNDPELRAMLGRIAPDPARTPAPVTPLRRPAPTMMAYSMTPGPLTPPAPRSTAITFSEMEVPPALQDRYKTPSPEAVPNVADRMAIAQGMVERPEDEGEIKRILAEADLFVKYGLVERAAEHLRRVFEHVPTHIGAHERLAAVLVQLGRKAEAAAELEILAQQVFPIDRTEAATYARRAVELNPSSRRAQEVLAAVAGRPAAAATQAPRELSANAYYRTGKTPEPEMIDSGEIELLGDGLSPEEGASQTAAVAALAEAFGSGRVDGDGPESFEEERTPATPNDRPYLKNEFAAEGQPEPNDDLTPTGPPDSGNEFSLDEKTPTVLGKDQEDEAPDPLLDDLEQVDFFIEQGLNDEAQALLDELETRQPGHILIADRREKLMGQQPGMAPQAQPEDIPTPGPTGPVQVDQAPMPQAARGAVSSQDLDSEADLGLMNKSMERHDLAIQHFTALLGDHKREVFALTMIGESQEAMGNHAEAMRCYQDALRSPRASEEEATQLYFLLGNVFYNAGDRAEALYYFERVCKRDPSFRDVQRRLAALKSRGSPH
ncbi:MAG TPA: tetratricopeptide repeat protein [Polyangia bacterium]